MKYSNWNSIPYLIFALINSCDRQVGIWLVARFALFNIYFCFLTQSPPFSPIKMLKVYSMFWFVSKCSVVVERKEEKHLKIRCPLEYSLGKPVKFPCAWDMVSCIHPISIRLTDWVSFWRFHSSFEKSIIESNNLIMNAIIDFKFLCYGGILDLARL